jgi:hypothetical protein
MRTTRGVRVGIGFRLVRSFGSGLTHQDASSQGIAGSGWWAWSFGDRSMGGRSRWYVVSSQSSLAGAETANR